MANSLRPAAKSWPSLSSPGCSPKPTPLLGTVHVAPCSYHFPCSFLTFVSFTRETLRELTCGRGWPPERQRHAGPFMRVSSTKLTQTQRRCYSAAKKVQVPKEQGLARYRTFGGRSIVILDAYVGSCWPAGGTARDFSPSLPLPAPSHAFPVIYPQGHSTAFRYND